MIQNITTNIMVDDVVETVKFYNEILGMGIIFTVDDEKNTGFGEILKSGNIVFAQVGNDQHKIMIQEKQNLAAEITELQNIKIGASMSFYITVGNINDYYSRCEKADVIIRELETSWYGMKEFVITDNSGYIIMFGEMDENYSEGK